MYITYPCTFLYNFSCLWGLMCSNDNNGDNCISNISEADPTIWNKKVVVQKLNKIVSRNRKKKVNECMYHSPLVKT